MISATDPSFTVGFAGLGLIGGSIARAIREKYPSARIKAWNRHSEVLRQAMDDHVVDIPLDSPSDGFADCDLIFLCVPVVTALGILGDLKSQVKPGAILTDVGSTKTAIHREASRLGLTTCFIGGHPMTGSEKSGYHNSQALFLENAYYLLTPGAEVSDDKVAFLESFIRSLGSLPLVMTYREHDRVVAGISHVPHLISASLVNMVREEDSPDGLMKKVAAGGFRDITRISSSSPAMWQEICLANRDAILPLLDSTIAQLNTCRRAVADSDADRLLDIFTSCRDYRDSMERRGRSEYCLYCDLADEKGAIARVASLLAEHDISLSNIGIIHNRDFEQGVLKLNFYDRSSLNGAVRLLRSTGYTVYENN